MLAVAVPVSIYSFTDESPTEAESYARVADIEAFVADEDCAQSASNIILTYTLRQALLSAR
jgi:hypothetical protein